MTATTRSVVVEGAAIATMDSSGAHDEAGAEYAAGHVVIRDSRITAVGPGPAPEQDGPVEYIDARGCLVTPGLVNTHHHLYQWATRGYAQNAALFDWLSELYPVWAGIDESVVHAAASAGLARLALSGCTAAADHHYVFPTNSGDLLGAVVEASRRVGTRVHAVRGSMDRGHSAGGLPPDAAVEDTDTALQRSESAIDRFHDPSPDATVRVALGPCSPFTVSERLMRGSAELARRRGVRLHTHLAETAQEQQQCAAEFGKTPVEYAEDLGWLGPDVWLAHTVHLSSAETRRLGTTGTGSAHCPSSNARLAAGTAPVPELLRAGSPVGLGADGAASNEDGGLGPELRQSLYAARSRCGADALSARRALWMATAGGAQCLGRDDEIGSLTVGALADIAVWRLSGIDHAGIADPVAALVLGRLPEVALLLRGGQVLVRDGALQTSSETDIARELRTASSTLVQRARSREVAS